MTEQIVNNSVKPLTQWVNLQQPLTFDDYCQAGGYQGAKVALLQHQPKEVLEIVKNSGLKRPRWRWFSHRYEVELCANV